MAEAKNGVIPVTLNNYLNDRLKEINLDNQRAGLKQLFFICNNNKEELEFLYILKNEPKLLEIALKFVSGVREKMEKGKSNFSHDSQNLKKIVSALDSGYLRPAVGRRRAYRDILYLKNVLNN